MTVIPYEHEFEMTALFSFFSTGDEEGEIFGGGGSYDIDEFAEEVSVMVRKALIRLLTENPNRTMSLVINTDDGKDPFENLSSTSTKIEGIKE